MLDYRMENGTERLKRASYTGYDSRGRKNWYSETDVTDGNEPGEGQIEAHKISYSYDNGDRITGISYPMSSGRIQGLRYHYDTYHRLDEIRAVLQNGSLQTVRTYLYDCLGRLSGMEDHPGVLSSGSSTVISREYTYNLFDQVTDMVYRRGSSILEEYHYVYDKNGNIIEKTEVNNTPTTESEKVNRTVLYSYDAKGQLISASETNHRQNEHVTLTQYAFDDAGNRIHKTKGSEQTFYTYDGFNQLLNVVVTDGNTTVHSLVYDYDENGNQIMESDSITGRTVTNRYDAANRLLEVSIQENDSGTFLQTNHYNGTGQRISKEENGAITRYYYDGADVSYTTGSDNSCKDLQYMSGISGSVFLMEQCDPSVSLYLYDKDIQGSTMSLLDENSQGVVSYRYDEYGQTEIFGDDSIRNELAYTGEIYDAATEQYYLNARYYDPENGRFLTQDTYRGESNKLDTHNLYRYCANDPVNYVDSSGHVSIKKSKEIIRTNKYCIKMAANQW